jgi:hypothetical protein
LPNRHHPVTKIAHRLETNRTNCFWFESFIKGRRRRFDPSVAGARTSGHPDALPASVCVSLLGDGSACQIVIIVHDPVNRAFRDEFNDAVGHGRDKLMVVGSE